MFNARQRVDPHNTYKAEGFRAAEEKALEILDILNIEQVHARTLSSLEIRVALGTESDEIGSLVITKEAIELRHPTIEWTMGSYGPAISTQLWKRYEWVSQEAKDIPQLLEHFKKAYKASLRACVFCKKYFQRSRMTDDACHGCATKHRGVVY